MRFRFNEKKTAQAAAFILSRHEGRMNYMALIKLLYLADRQALIERGFPISGDHLVSMPQGPVLSTVLDRITWRQPREPMPWFQYISESLDYEVALAGALETDELSEFELEVLGRIDEQFGEMSEWDLVAYTHTLPEWDDPHGSSFPLDPEAILRGAGISDEEIRRITERAEALRCFDVLASRPE